MDTWASCSSSSASCTSDASSEFSEDSDVEGGVNLSGEEIRVMSARREVLHQAEGVGFMASLADMKKGVATKGRKIGGGGSGEVFELEVVDRDLQEELLSFTVGAGVVLKKFKKVSATVMTFYAGEAVSEERRVHVDLAMTVDSFCLCTYGNNACVRYSLSYRTIQQYVTVAYVVPRSYSKREGVTWVIGADCIRANCTCWF